MTANTGPENVELENADKRKELLHFYAVLSSTALRSCILHLVGPAFSDSTDCPMHCSTLHERFYAACFGGRFSIEDTDGKWL